MHTKTMSATGRKASVSRGESRHEEGHKGYSWNAVNRELAKRSEAAILQTKFSIRMEEALLERLAGLDAESLDFLRGSKSRMEGYANEVSGDITSNVGLMDAWSLEWNIERFLIEKAVTESMRRIVPEVMDLFDSVEAKKAMGF